MIVSERKAQPVVPLFVGYVVVILETNCHVVMTHPGSSFTSGKNSTASPPLLPGECLCRQRLD